MGCGPPRRTRAQLRDRFELHLVKALAREMAIAREIARPAASIVRSLGRRPTNSELRPAWDRAVAVIAGYRHDRDLADEALSALGPPPTGGPKRLAWQMAAREAGRAAAALGRVIEPKALFDGHARCIEFER